MFRECTREASLVLSNQQCEVGASQQTKIYIMVLVDLSYCSLPANTSMCRGGATFLTNDDRNVSGTANLDFCLCKYEWREGESEMVS